MVPPDVDPMFDDVDHWVRKTTRLMRPLERYDPSLQFIMLTNEG